MNGKKPQERRRSGGEAHEEEFRMWRRNSGGARGAREDEVEEELRRSKRSSGGGSTFPTEAAGISILIIDPSGRATSLCSHCSNPKRTSRLCLQPLNRTQDKGVCFDAATPENQQSNAGNNLPALQLAEANKKNSGSYTQSSLLEVVISPVSDGAIDCGELIHISMEIIV